MYLQNYTLLRISLSGFVSQVVSNPWGYVILTDVSLTNADDPKQESDKYLYVFSFYSNSLSQIY